MISDGIENCLQYLDNFNPQNQTILLLTLHKLYITLLLDEFKKKKQTTIKQKMIADSNYDDMTLQPGEDREFKNQFTEFLKQNLPKEEDSKLVRKEKEN